MNVLKTYQMKQCFRQFMKISTSTRFNSYSYYEEASDVINNVNVNASTNWDSLRKEICGIGRNFNALNVHSVIIDSFLRTGKINEALIYVDDVKQNNKKLPLAINGRLFKIYGILGEQGNLSEQQEKEVLEMYNAIKTEYKVLDTFTNEAMIVALCKTKFWEKSLLALKEIRVASNPTEKVFNGIIQAAFKNKNYSLGWQLLEEVIALGREPLPSCYLAYLESVTENGVIKDFVALEKLFEFFEQNDICSSKSFTDKLQECAITTKIDHKIIITNSKGTCNNCNQQISQKSLTDDEFELLKDNFLNKIIIGKDVFCKTNPSELQEFKDFIKEGRKYDVIIDGLNVAYTTMVKTKNFAKTVATVLNHFVKQKKKVLIFGRQHMKKWSPNYFNYIKNNSDLFLTEDISQDDPFFLYCALNSGKDTILVSRDLMRSHVFLLKDIHLKRLFNRWISLCRHELVTVTKEEKPIFKFPLPYLRTSKKVGDYWHIFIKESEECLCIKTKI